MNMLYPITHAFQQLGIETFADAAEWVRGLPYGRNADKDNLLSVFQDGCGTCSTKHALLKTFADEKNMGAGIVLMLGIYRMTRENTPQVATILTQHSLTYLPEAHNYLRISGEVLDVTFPSETFVFEPDLLSEILLSPTQISTYKIAYHQEFLAQWLLTQPHLSLTLNELWAIREACIQALAAEIPLPYRLFQ